MRWWLTTLVLTTAIAVGNAQTFSIQWLSFVLNGGAPVPIRINPVSGLVDLINGVTVDSRFPSVNADGTRVVFQVGSGNTAQVWEAIFDLSTNQWQSVPVLIPNTNQPLLGLHPVISTDGNHIAFASAQDYGFGSNGRQQIYILDRTQNRIVPISVLWLDVDGDGVRDTYLPSLGNCIPVYVSSDGRIIVFLAEWLIDDDLNAPNHPAGDPLGNDHPPQNAESSLYIVDADGDGRHEPVPIPPTNQPDKWLLLIHDRDADGNGVYDEAGIGSTRTFIGSHDELNRLAPTTVLTVCANGRFIAFVSTYDNDNDGLIDEDPEDSVDNDGDNQIDEDPPDERWRIVVRDWQNGVALSIDNAFVPALSDDGLYIAYLEVVQVDNDGDGQVNEDPVDGVDNDNDGQVDEDPPETYLQTTVDLVIRQLIDPATGQPPAQLRELRLSGLQLPPQFGTANGASGYGYSDWWGAATIAVDPQNPNIAYVAFHSWASNIIDLQNATLNPQVNFYQGVPNIFLARFNFDNWDNAPNAPNRVQLWRLTEWTNQQVQGKQRGLPVSLQLVNTNPLQYRLPLGANLLPVVSFVQMDMQGNRLMLVVFQSLAPFDQSDTNGLWDIYFATVPLP